MTTTELRRKIAGLSRYAREEILSLTEARPQDLEDLPDMPAWRIGEVLRLRASIATRTRIESDGSLSWLANDAPVPVSCFEEAFLPVPAAQAARVERSTREFLARYKADRAGRTLSAEERFEQRAAFGPGVTLVDVVTGQRMKT